MAKSYTFLQLSQEFGGTKFGPFDGVEIRLGSDPQRSDITLPEALGVATEHVKVLIQTDGSFIIAPVDRTAAVFHWRRGSNRSKQISAPMAVQSGDGFSLVTPEGPRFYIELVKSQTQAKEAAEKSEGPGWNRPRGLTGSGLMAEIKRRGLATVLTSKVGNQLNSAWTFIKTGQLFAPRYVVSGMLLASGWVFAGSAGCGALSLNRSKGRTMKELTTCRDQLGVANDGEDSAGPTVPSLTRKILVDREWQTTVESDAELYKAYAKHLKIIFAASDRYKWVYSNKAGDFARFKKALEGTGMPPNLVRTMAYAAARPGSGQIREWWLVENSDEEEVCGRGPLALTYAQGYRLGLSNLQLDAMVKRSVASGNDIGEQVAALEATAQRIDVAANIDQDIIESAGAQLQGGVECLYVGGDDDRSDLNLVAQAMRTHLGASVSRGLPRESDPYWIAARLTRLYAMDFGRGYDDLDFDPKYAPSTAMELGDVKGSRAAYAIDSAAEVIARAVAVPCLATLDKDISGSPPPFMGELPVLGHCAIAKAFVEYDRL